MMITLKDCIEIADDGMDLITKKAENNRNGMYNLTLYDTELRTQ